MSETKVTTKTKKFGNFTSVALFFLLIALFLFPPLLDSYYLNLLIVIVYGIYLAQCWNIMSGLAGQFSFGHATFFGLGAYTSSLLFTKAGLTPWLGMLTGGAVAAVMGLFIGFLAFRYRLKGHYFALATLAFAEIFRVLALNWRFMGGAMGILIPLGDQPAYFQFKETIYFYYIILIMALFITFLVYRLGRSKLGLYLVAIRENEEAAEALGVNSFRYKLAAVSLSAFLTALGGTFYAQLYSYIDPELTFGSNVSVNILTPAIIGGVGTVWGPVVGSLVLTPISEFTRGALSSGISMIVYGLIIIAVIIYLPEGIVGFIQKIWRRRAILRQKANPAETVPGEIQKGGI
ncbi:MAG: branched-chain amino acid ABC transporter permease [Armatimonadetes bacterium]|nr:branched-chain amino acid ABC transporter permease [Armatimonadota bacterium]